MPSYYPTFDFKDARLVPDDWFTYDDALAISRLLCRLDEPRAAPAVDGSNKMYHAGLDFSRDTWRRKFIGPFSAAEWRHRATNIMEFDSILIKYVSLEQRDTFFDTWAGKRSDCDD